MSHFIPPLFYFILLLAFLTMLPFISILPTDRALGETKNFRGANKPVGSEAQGNPAVFQASGSPPPPPGRPSPASNSSAASTGSNKPNSNPGVGETKMYVIDLPRGEDIIVTVADNEDPSKNIPEMVGNEQPSIVNGEDVFISSWWTIDDQRTAFESWDQLETFLKTRYGGEPQTGINPKAENLAVEIQVEIPANFTKQAQLATAGGPGTEDINQDMSKGMLSYADIVQYTAAVDWTNYSQTEVDGVKVYFPTLITTLKPICKQVSTCQKVFVRGLRNVCKNQLVCPKI